MRPTASDTARALGRSAETVCRHYLSRGRRMGGYWIVGDILNNPGRSLFVRLRGPEYGPGACGKWADAATGEHGDLLDLIRLACGLTSLKDAIEEAQEFLSLPPPITRSIPRPRRPSSPSNMGAARRLYAGAQPLKGTLGEAYLRARGIDTDVLATPLRFHPRLLYREGKTAQSFPGLVAAVTDALGCVTGVQRLFLDPNHPRKADVEDPRRSLGHLLGNGVRFGEVSTALAAGEGIETMLSLATVIPNLPVVAASSAAHLAAINLPANLTRLYIARDNDVAGRWAAARLEVRAIEMGIPSILHLIPALKDFNDDLRELGVRAFAERLAPQLASEERARLTLTA
ncbi:MULTISPECIES: toprim domain-containing protein [Rhodomicrobium]|uniref:DUF7146 domain-containing protein n=1 Tax=Rhodomicrobium TaxID=1068 RepID=UPI000B4BFEEF|nr:MULTISPECIES: toprim domain-containing protein [Rhodomicrobium]